MLQKWFAFKYKKLYETYIDSSLTVIISNKLA